MIARIFLIILFFILSFLAIVFCILSIEITAEYPADTHNEDEGEYSHCSGESCPLISEVHCVDQSGEGVGCIPRASVCK